MTELEGIATMDAAVDAMCILVRTGTSLKAMRNGARCLEMGPCVESCWNSCVTAPIELGMLFIRISRYRLRTTNAPKHNTQRLETKGPACGWSLCMSSWLGMKMRAMAKKPL